MLSNLSIGAAACRAVGAGEVGAVSTRLAVLWGLVLFLLAASGRAAEPAHPGGGASDSGDVVATVAGEPIHEWEVLQAINSTPMQGYAGQIHTTPTGVRVKRAFLENLINQRLLYLEAKAQGLDRTREYRDRLASWERAALADLYTRDYFNRHLKITDADIEAAWEKEKNRKHGANPLDPEMRQIVRNKLAARRFSEVRAALAKELGPKVEVQAEEQDLALNGDAERDPDRVVAVVCGEEVTWRQARPRLLPKRSVGERRAALRKLGVQILEARKARRLGLDRDPAFRHRKEDFERTLVAALLMERLRKRFTPSDEAFAAYYKAHPDEFTVPERRRLQQIVVRTRKEAEALRKEILEETTEDYDPFYKLAQERSIDPTAGRTSGVLGWLAKGSGTIAPELEKVAFSLKVKEVSPPVEGPGGWHLIRTLEVRPAVHLSLEQIEESGKRERYDEVLFKRKFEPYMAELRKKYKVVVDRAWFDRGPKPVAAAREVPHPPEAGR
ncbi:MAG: peptidyl-prolyl cis-trans isomerase [Nitrospirae bacterium]|nr:MAG: peptidyl-prolyl cis-trans isomerase [Nitrospirota bacterium]